MQTLANGSLHSHTTWSDGRNSVEDMVAAAEARDFDYLGISDHLVLRPDRVPVEWSMRPGDVEGYVADVREVARRHEMPVRLGLEVDFFPDNPRTDELADILSRHAFDYLIGSVHIVGDFPLDDGPAAWRTLSQGEIDAVHARYWKAIARLPESGLFDCVGHLDLPKKFNVPPRVDLQELIENALDAIANSAIQVELNTAGWDKPCAECYPSPEVLAACLERGIPVRINDDAHAVEQLGRYFARATTLLNDLRNP